MYLPRISFHRSRLFQHFPDDHDETEFSSGVLSTQAWETQRLAASVGHTIKFRKAPFTSVPEEADEIDRSTERRSLYHSRRRWDRKR